jgi:predicted porin
MKFRSLPVIIFLLVLTQFLFSQSNDFGIWYGVNAEYSIKKKLEIDLSTEVRTFSNASKIEEAFLETGITYSFNKYISVTGGYRITENLEGDSRFHIRHKWFADIKGKNEIGNFSFSGRFRFQRQDKTYFEDANDEIADYHGRIKFKVIYKTPSFPINPFISFETFFRMFEATDKRFDKNRFMAGLEYKIDKKQSFEAAYMFERDFFPHLSDMNIISVSYNIKF